MFPCQKPLWISLLDVLNIRYIVHQENTGVVEGPMQTYQWGEREREQDGQPACQNILENEILSLDLPDEYGVYDIRGRKLPEIKAGKQKSTGFSDTVTCSFYDFKHASRRCCIGHRLRHQVAAVTF